MNDNVVGGTDKGEEGNVQHTAHTEINGFGSIGSHHQAQQKFAEYAQEQADGSRNGDADA